MTQFEMTEKLSVKYNVTLEEARAALEASEWNMLDAALMLERNHSSRPAAKSAGDVKKDLLSTLRGLLARGNRNHFVVRHGDEAKLELPVTIFALLMLVSFGTCALLLVVGLFAGCRYSFNGPDFDRNPTLNDALDKAADAAARVKESVV